MPDAIYIYIYICICSSCGIFCISVTPWGNSVLKFSVLQIWEISYFFWNRNLEDVISSIWSPAAILLLLFPVQPLTSFELKPHSSFLKLLTQSQLLLPLCRTGLLLSSDAQFCPQPPHPHDFVIWSFWLILIFLHIQRKGATSHNMLLLQTWFCSKL